MTPEFEKLLKDVWEVDRRAFKNLLELSKDSSIELNFYASPSCLAGCFCWDASLQGEEYWREIDRKLNAAKQKPVKGESKMELNKGDKVTLTDGSYAIKLHSTDWKNHFINEPSRRGEEFIVVDFTYLQLRTKRADLDIHDIVIQSCKTGEVYLHSSSFVEVVEPPKCPCCGKEI